MSDATPTPGHENGRFAKGNKFGVGSSPHGAKIAEYRKLLYDSTSPAEMLAIWANILACAQDRSDKDWLKAAGLVFERLLGPPPDGELELKVEKLEQLVAQYQAQQQTRQERAA